MTDALLFGCNNNQKTEKCKHFETRSLIAVNVEKLRVGIWELLLNSMVHTDCFDTSVAMEE